MVNDKSGDAIVIDCGAFFEAERKAVVAYIENKGLRLRHVLCTHAHFDHIFGVDTLYDTFGLKPRLHPADQSMYERMGEQVATMFGMHYDRQMPPLGDTFDNGQTIGFGSHNVEVLHTPGHSPGSVLLYIKDEKTVFTGDTLFRMSVGRSDLEGGSWTALTASLRNVVAQLPADVKVYTGHGPCTTIGDELAMNPYLKN